MARNQYAGDCYQCGELVAAGTGHFEKHAGGWRVKHANVPGDGRVTCDMAAHAAMGKERTEQIAETSRTGCVN